MTCPEEKIRSSGYVVDTLEAAIWCLMKTKSYSAAVLTGCQPRPRYRHHRGGHRRTGRSAVQLP
ncbi:MAG: hypothetical protein MZV63_55180 [Marinilabiliales bacterium]|nr:hypothetical protein [Marinilabiliales bacterium]